MVGHPVLASAENDLQTGTFASSTTQSKEFDIEGHLGSLSEPPSASSLPTSRRDRLQGKQCASAQTHNWNPEFLSRMDRYLLLCSLLVFVRNRIALWRWEVFNRKRWRPVGVSPHDLACQHATSSSFQRRCRTETSEASHTARCLPTSETTPAAAFQGALRDAPHGGLDASHALEKLASEQVAEGILPELL